MMGIYSCRTDAFVRRIHFCKRIFSGQEMERMTAVCEMALQIANSRRMRMTSLFFLGLMSWPLAGCAHRFRVDPVDSAPLSTATTPEKVHPTGSTEPVINPIDCAGNGVAEVIVSRNFGQRLGFFVSLGFYDPVTVEWKCAKDSYATSPPF